MVEMEKRDHPKSYIDRAIKILKETVVHPISILEIGCCRQPLNHDVDNETCFGCCDGHSTYLWGRTGWHVDSVDINMEHILISAKICNEFKNVNLHNMDAIELANSVSLLAHDLLFLDAWDVELPDCAEKHLEFYRAAKEKMTQKCLILIDDTDLYFNQYKREFFPDPECLSGKGQLLIPELIKDGYEIVFKGRQTLLRKKCV
jgi:hypothetical protein